MTPDVPYRDPLAAACARIAALEAAAGICPCCARRARRRQSLKLAAHACLGLLLLGVVGVATSAGVLFLWLLVTWGGSFGRW